LDANYYRVAIIGPWPEGVKSSQPPVAENADEVFESHAAATPDIAEELRKRAENRCSGAGCEGSASVNQHARSWLLSKTSNKC
jgi:hypothetical protein